MKFPNKESYYWEK